MQSRINLSDLKNSLVVVCALAGTLMVAGCSRTAYRLRADKETVATVWQKTESKPWVPPSDFSVYPDPESRLHKESCTDCPQLPVPAAELYSYQLSLKKSKGSDVDDKEPEPLGIEDGETTLVSPIPPNAWLEIPTDCRRRMFDFASLRDEAINTEEKFGIKIVDGDTDSIPKLALDDIIDQALLNSREYQAQKESLYRVALQLTAERYAYLLNPTASGNGADLAFSHNRFGGLTENGLSIPSGIGFQRALATGGDFLARFANNVLLTFKGPQGFAADVSSDLLFQYTQPLLQRDIQLESLTQAERNVVYAARDFARFRKQFFVDFAADYYSLILDFRRVEIDSQNYFSLVRAFNQAEAEYRAGVVPRFQVDQVEQNLLQGRGRLIGTCNGIEQSLDQLKISIGLPTETLVNIDLSEINELTKRDQLAVSGDLIDRVRRRLGAALSGTDRVELLSTGTVLLNRLIEAGALQAELGDNELDVKPFEIQRTRIQIATRRLASQQIEKSLDSEIESDSPSLPIIFQRSLSLSDSLLTLVDRQLELADLLDAEAEEIKRFQQKRNESAENVVQLREELQQLIREEKLQQFPDLVDRGRDLQERIVTLTQSLDQINGVDPVLDNPNASMQATAAKMEELVAEANSILDRIETGLAPIEVDVDEAMLTALSQRFDLMNTREQLADDWRRVKYAADDLKSVLNLQAAHRIRTVDGSNQPFNFTFDESTTSVNLSFDAPLNRRLQRNSYRNSLFNYQQGLRTLMAAEDSVKFSIRNDLRNLALDREQYYIAVASAALAYERVVSTSLEFRLGTGGVTARDFLEAQTAYTDALTSVASQHIGYILDRTQLFLDLELLTVDENGFWNELYDESFQPQLYLDIPPWALPVYGCLPDVRFSSEIQSMLFVPPGTSAIYRERNNGGEVTAGDGGNLEDERNDSGPADLTPDAARPGSGDALVPKSGDALPADADSLPLELTPENG